MTQRPHKKLVTPPEIAELFCSCSIRGCDAGKKPSNPARITARQYADSSCFWWLAMTKPHEPRPYDAVLGGQSAPPASAAVLGGLEGVKQRLSSNSEAVRMAALSEALKYGQPGWELVFQIFRSSTGSAQWAVYDQLWNAANPKIRKQLLKYIPLQSDVGIDYTKLRDLLAVGEWEKAEAETRKLMLRVADRENVGYLYIGDIEHFPCSDLHAIDQLWVKSSNGRFGFSVQKRIWEDVGGKTEPSYKTFCRFGDRVGWRAMGNWINTSAIAYHLSAPRGHLPHRPHGHQLSPVGVWEAFFLRAARCHL